MRIVLALLVAVLVVSMSFSLVLVRGLYFPSGVVSWWPAEGNPNDIVNGNDGTLYDDTSFAAGKVGQAFSFDGDGDYVAVADDASLKPAAITVDAWFYATNIVGHPPIVRKAEYIDTSGPAYVISNIYGYSLEINQTDSKVRFWVYISGAWHSSPGALVTTGVWYHVAGSYDGSSIKLYLNGQPAGSTSLAGTITHSDLALLIGGENNPPLLRFEYFTGKIDEVEIFSRALSDKEIMDIYNGIKQGPPIIESCDSNGVAKDIFVLGDNVYVSGSGFRGGQKNVRISVVDHTSWVDGMKINWDIGRSTIGDILPSGEIPFGVIVWWHPLTPGAYDIVADVGDDGYYNAGTDALDDHLAVGAGFIVINHDIAVTDVKASPTTVIVGNPVSVEVKVLNEGTVQETFDVNTYYDSNLIGTMSVTLSSGASTTLTFTWDTTSVSPGTYTIKAEVPPVTGETHIADNEFIDGKVTINPVPIYVDIKPGSWPNSINVGSKGVFAVAICGTKDFDVKTVDPTTVKLYIAGIALGVSPIRWSYQDVATPYTGPPGGGQALGGDGYLDLVLFFDTKTAVVKLGLAGHAGETIPLIIKGNLYPAAGGLPIQGQDYVKILKS